MTATTMPLMTAGEFVAKHENERVELIDGVVVEMPVPQKIHGYVVSNFGTDLTVYVRATGLGRVITGDSFVQLPSTPGKAETIVGPDIAFYSYGAMPQVPKTLTHHLPELVVEVRSPTDREKAVIGKINRYLNAGIPVVIQVDPENFSLTVYRKGELQQVFDNGDDLTIPDVLPGFSVKVRSLFE